MVKDRFSCRNRKMQKGLKCENNSSAFLYSVLGFHCRKTVTSESDSQSLCTHPGRAVTTPGEVAQTRYELFCGYINM